MAPAVSLSGVMYMIDPSVVTGPLGMQKWKDTIGATTVYTVQRPWLPETYFGTYNDPRGFSFTYTSHIDYAFKWLVYYANWVND